MSLKYFKRKNIYKNSNGNVTFNPKTLDAYSYEWWKFCGKVTTPSGRVITVFNYANYSMSTNKHQHSVFSLLNELGIKIHLMTHIDKNESGYIHNVPLNELRALYRRQFELTDKLARARNKDRLKLDLKDAKANIKIIERFGYKISKKELKTMESEVKASLERERLKARERRIKRKIETLIMAEDLIAIR